MEEKPDNVTPFIQLAKALRRPDEPGEPTKRHKFQIETVDGGFHFLEGTVLGIDEFQHLRVYDEDEDGHAVIAGIFAHGRWQAAFGLPDEAIGTKDVTHEPGPIERAPDDPRRDDWTPDFLQ